ncbi:45261_t:CDS:2 [Gigaspora margarita]|uniref:45261_t:CDS:1 n=1 Tax=Gigaspora margarita TaxID=4874 RepID=A0ABM8W476_GIGMA|nr:45261_t:CDS:2 [Gigaspora margarita]
MNTIVMMISILGQIVATQLRFEKGFKINKDGSVTSASIQAFKINLDRIKLEKKKFQYEGVHECNHETTIECKRFLIFDVKPSAAYSEWISNSFRLSHKNSNQTFKNTQNIPNIHMNFIEDVEIVVSATTNDKINKLYEITEKYDYFYNKTSWIQSLNDATKWKIIGYEDVYSLFELLDHELKHKVLNIIGHQILEAKVDEIRFNIKEYENNKKPYIHKLLITKKIISINECNILASIVSVKNNKNQDLKIKLKLNSDRLFLDHQQVSILVSNIHWYLKVGNFSLLENKITIISNCGMFGTCVLETPNIISQIETSPQVENSLRVKNNPQIETSSQIENSSQIEINSDIDEVICDQIKYDPKNSTFAIGNYLIRCQVLAHQESARLFVYDIESNKKVTDENVLKRLPLSRHLNNEIIGLSDIIQFKKVLIIDLSIVGSGQPWHFNLLKFCNKKIALVKNKEILYSSEEIKTSNDNLILVNQIFDHDECKNQQPLGFVNIISDKIFYGSLNSKHLNIVESDGSIVYFSIPLKSIAKS